MDTSLDGVIAQLQRAPWGFSAQFSLAGLLLAALVPATVLIAWRRRGALGRDDLAVLGGCLILGLAVRGLAVPFPSDIRSALDMGFTIAPSHNWAAGYSFVQHVLFLALPATLENVCRANILFDMLSVGLVWALSRRFLRDPAAAAAAAAVYAAQPVSARFAASDSAHVLLTSCYLLSLWLVAVWREEGKLRILVAAAAWWAFACNVRMEAVIFAPAAALIAGGMLSDAPLRREHAAPALLAAAPFLVFPAADILGHLRDGHGAFNLSGLFSNPLFQGSDIPVPVAAAALLGIGAALRSPAWRVGAARWLAALALIALPSMPLRETEQTNYRYFLPMLALWAVPAGQGAALAAGAFFAGRPGPRLRPLALIALVAAASAPWWGFLRKTWTHQLEFMSVRRQLREIDDGCAIVRLARFRSEAGLEISPMLSLEAGRSHRWVDVEDFLKAPSFGACVMYYQAASCHGRDSRGFLEPAVPVHVRAECREMRERFRLEPVAESRLPAAPYGAESYTEDPVPVGWYRVISEDAAYAAAMSADMKEGHAKNNDLR
jgi:hypothetical protein